MFTEADFEKSGQYPAGTVLKITATPNDGYNFKNIQKNLFLLK